MRTASAGEGAAVRAGVRVELAQLAQLVGLAESIGMTERRRIRLRVKRLEHGAGLELPTPASSGSAGLDLRAALPADRPLTLSPGARARVPTGLAMQIPDGWEGQVRPRSGLAARYGLALVNAPGTIDSDYRGEVQVLLVNLGEEPVAIARGERIAQLVLAPVPEVALEEVSELAESERGGGGFGSTGSG